MFARVKRWREAVKLKRRACKAARRVFDTSKNEKSNWALVFAEEADSFIVLVAYGLTRPPSRAFYRVAKTLNCVTNLEVADLEKQYRIPVWR